MKFFCRHGDQQREYEFFRRGGQVVARCDGHEHLIDLALVGDGGAFSLLVDGRSYDVLADVQRDQVVLQLLGERFVVQVEDERERAAHAAAGHHHGGHRELRAAMPGIVVDLRVRVGDHVEEGQTLVVLEAMKMQNPLAAMAAGRVTRVLCKQGDAVAAGALLIETE
jgi:pyruvate carboxylase subunit B